MPIRVCFIGDSITNGYGDETMAGWPARVSAAANAAGHDVTAYNLGVRADTSELIRVRWRDEASRRLPDELNGALVISFGINDCAQLDGVRRVEPARSEANARAVLAEAKAWLPTLFVGPTPIDGARSTPQLLPGHTLEIGNEPIEAMSKTLGAVAAELQVPYLDLFTRLSAEARWRDTMARGDGVHPPTAGYALIGGIVAAWAAWRALLGGAAG
jgi:lysophospholipase L1-like esterase